MAASDPLHRQPRASPGPVTLHGLPGVLGTARREPAARRQQRRDRRLVGPDPEQEDGLHRSAPVHSASAALNRLAASPYAAGLARTRISRGGFSRLAPGNHSVRRNSRTRRFSRLRSTTVCPCSGMMIAARASWVVERLWITSSGPHRRLEPSRRRARISGPRRRRAERGYRRRCPSAKAGRFGREVTGGASGSSRRSPSASDDPSGDGAPGPFGPPSSSCGHGTRGP